MLGKCIECLSYILFAVALVLIIIDKKQRKLWGVVLVLAGIASVFTSLVPLENAFYSFPTAEAVAKYACKGEVIEILDGKESSMILYSKESGTVSYMLSSKTERGYKIGTNHDIRKHSRVTSIPIPQAQIQVTESANAIDKYVYVLGIVEGEDVVISDTQRNHFLVFKESSSQAGIDRTLFRAFCILSNVEDEDYRITINGTKTKV